MSKVNLNIRMDADLKKETESILNKLGLNMTTAINIFARTVVRQKRIPFDIALEEPNAETKAAMQEIEDMRNGKLRKHPQSVESMFKELDINVDR